MKRKKKPQQTQTKPQPSPQPTINQIALLLALLTFLTRFIYIFNFLTPGQYVKWMPFQNHTRAQQVLQKGQAFYGNAWGSYYLVLASQYYLFHQTGITDTTTASVILHIIFTSLAIFFFYKLAAKLSPPPLAIISSTMLMLYFPGVYLNAQLVSENLFLPLLIIGLYLTINLKTNLKIPKLNSALSGFILAFAAALRPILLPFLLFFILWFLSRSKTQNKIHHLTNPALLTLTLTLTLTIFTLLNQRFSHQHLPQLTASTGVNFTLTQCNLKKITYQTPTNESYWFSPPAHWNTDLEQITTDIPFYNQQHYFKMGLRCLFDNPKQLFTNFTHIENIFSSIFYPEYDPKPHIENLITFWKILSIISFSLFLLYPLTAAKHQKQFYAPFFLLLLSLFLSVYLANPGEERYLIPYAWVFFLFAPITIKNIIFGPNK